jgi:hypothetical protein
MSAIPLRIGEPKRDYIVREKYRPMSLESLLARAKVDHVTGEIRLHLAQGTVVGITVDAIVPGKS